MNARALKNWSGREPTETDGPCIVTTCPELSDVAPMASEFEKLNTGRLLTYNRQAELRFNPPVGEVSLFVLIDREFLEPTADTLRWLGRCWPGTATVVVGATGSGGQELMARMGRAIYFVYPACGGQWLSLVWLAIGQALRRRETGSSCRV